MSELKKELQLDTRDQNQNKTKLPWIILIVMGIITVIAGTGIVRTGADAISASYKEAYEQQKASVYQNFYDKYYKNAEKKYHVSNRVSINIEDIKEVANLEVLKVSDVEYVIENAADNKNGISSWLEVPGEGIYIVNLQAAEFIVDDEREYIRVRVPYPELVNISLDYMNIKPLLFQNDVLNDSYKVGEELAKNQLNTADILIKKEFLSNEQYYLNAQKAAVSTIQCLIRRLNPENPELDIDVEFY